MFFWGLGLAFFFQSQYVECTHQVHLVNFDISLVVAYCRFLSYCFLQVPKALEKESSELTCFYPSLSLSLCVCELFKSSNWIWCGEILKHWCIICFKCKRNVITNTREISIATDEPVTFLTEYCYRWACDISNRRSSTDLGLSVRICLFVVPGRCYQKYLALGLKVFLLTADCHSSTAQAEFFFFKCSKLACYCSTLPNLKNGIMNLEMELWTERCGNCDAKGICTEIRLLLISCRVWYFKISFKINLFGFCLKILSWNWQSKDRLLNKHFQFYSSIAHKPMSDELELNARWQ